MKNKKIIIIILTAILTLFIFGGLIKNSLKNHGAKKTESISEVIYYCPMHPAYTSDRPGDCPICNMKLVKRANGKLSSEGKSLQEVCIEHNCTMNNCTMHVVADIKSGEKIICPVCGEVISAGKGKVVEAKQTAPLDKKEKKILYYRNPMNPQVTSPVAMKDSMGMDYVPVYEESLPQAENTVQISPEKQQLIGIKTEVVKKMNLVKEVKAFGKIAYDPDLYVAQEEYLQALKTLNATKNSVLSSVTQQSDSLAQAAEKKLLLLGMSQDEIKELAQKGSAQTGLYLPSEKGSVWGYVDIYEYEIGLVKPGMSVEIDTDAYPGEVFQGKIISLNPVLDPASRTNRVRVELDNPAGKLKPEMFINAKIKADLGEKLAVPESAVLDTGIRKVVYLSKPQDLLEMHEVSLGQKALGYYEVLGGLKEGDIVVTSGNFLVDSESKLQSAVQGATHQHTE